MPSRRLARMEADLDDVANLRRGMVAIAAIPGPGGRTATSAIRIRSMGAVVHGGLCAGVEGALNAGVDLLLVSWDVDKVYPAIRCALDAADAGRLDPRMMAASARRLDALVARSADRSASSEPSRR